MRGMYPPETFATIMTASDDDIGLEREQSMAVLLGGIAIVSMFFFSLLWWSLVFGGAVWVGFSAFNLLMGMPTISFLHAWAIGAIVALLVRLSYQS